MTVAGVNPVRLPALIWLAAVTSHNLEEAIWLPAWSQTAAAWQAPMGEGEFRVAAVLLTLLFAVLVALSMQRVVAAGWTAWLLGGCALAMALNFVGPHLAATLATGRYMPGLATSALLVVPSSLWLLVVLFRARLITWPRFAWIGPLVVLGIVAIIPLMFRIGRAVTN